MAQVPKARPAHVAGPTFLSYTPNGRQLVTVGANDTIRIFETGSDGEPINVDNTTDANTAVVATNQFFVTGAEDGSVNKYSLDTNLFEETLTRATLPIRDLSLSPDKQWVAVASDELVVKIVHVDDMTHVRYIRDLPKPTKHLTFDFSGETLLLSCTDGNIYVYDVSTEEPVQTQKLDGLIGSLESESQHSSRAIWHPDGRAIALPTPTRDIQVVSRKNWQPQKKFNYGHTGLITALAWSPNGALLVTGGVDRSVSLWDTSTQKVIHQIADIRAPVWAFSWHPTENILSYTNNNGEAYIHNDFVPPSHVHLLRVDLQPAPMNSEPLSEVSGNAVRKSAESAEADKHGHARRARDGTPNSLDEILGPEEDDEWSNLDGFVEDDDGQGYAEEVNRHGKRSNAHLDDSNQAPLSKRRAVWQPQVHEPFQPGSTPWRGNRRYLCLNLLGFIWTVDQDTHHTVTVEFYDREFNRDFHFTDPYGYDKACLTEKGALLASQPRDNDQNAMLYYRPHETWTTRSDWRTELPKGESITSIALSDSYIVATTSAEYVRVFTLFGTPIHVYRHKSSPIVTCASWRDYILTIGNGPVGSTGQTRLVYTIENIKREKTCQSEDVVALPGNAELQSVFFSDAGDPCIYDTDGVLLVLQHWRKRGSARWVPLLDTRSLSRLASGRKSETYWPVAVANDKFYCIILKGGDRYPYFPRPLLAEFDFEIPLRAPPKANSADESGEAGDKESEDNAMSQTQRLEHSYVLSSLMHSLSSDLVSATTATSAQRTELASKALEIDKVLLQLLAAECIEGEDRGMKALEIVKLMPDNSGRMLEAAVKVAARFGRDVLRGKIEELAERRVVGLDTEDE